MVIPNADMNFTTLKRILLDAADQHAPLSRRRLPFRPPKPWYNETIHRERVERRRLERRWLKTGLEVDKQIYQQQCARGRGY